MIFLVSRGTQSVGTTLNVVTILGLVYPYSLVPSPDSDLYPVMSNVILVTDVDALRHYIFNIYSGRSNIDAFFKISRDICKYTYS